MRLIDKNSAIDAVAFGITYAKAFDKETGEVKELFAQSNYELRKAVDRIKELPSTDAVEVVRCKDCIHWDESWVPMTNPTGHYCAMIDLSPDGEFYCADAERRKTDVK